MMQIPEMVPYMSIIPAGQMRAVALCSVWRKLFIISSVKISVHPDVTIVADEDALQLL